jgi:YHS domain-containing protein
VIKIVIDPVCKMKVDEKTCKYKSEYKGKTYYFCAPGCKMDFDDHPEQYVEESGKSEGKR